MKTILKQAAALCLMTIPALLPAQVDLTIGLNYSYNPPTNCNNQITGLTVDICNNGNSPAGSFLVGIYLYDPSSQNHWVVDQTTLNSLSGNACVTISNWNIDLNSYPNLPAPGSNYRLGVWADTANVITESNKNNNTALLSGNIQVCAGATAIRSNNTSVDAFNVFPNPVASSGKLSFTLSKEEKVAVSIYDITGKALADVFSGTLAQGTHNINFEIAQLSSGVYFAMIKTGSGTSTRKIMVQK